MEGDDQVDGQRETPVKVNTKDEAAVSKTKASKIEFGVDLVEGAIAHLEFLRCVDVYPCLFKGPYLKRSIMRYEVLWLPLVAENSQEILAAPLDIEWIWHCHILAPHFYQKDCKNFYGKHIGHKLLRTSERNQALLYTQDLWNAKYPQEPFEVDLPSGCYFENIKTDFHSKLSYNIEEASLRQGTFYYNVSLPHYMDKKFLSLCVLRYKKFLYLKMNTKDAFLVPCYDNDLIWHTHQLFPKIYYQDTCRLLGHLYNHDDSTTDRSPGSTLSLAYAETIRLWKNLYNEKYSLPGAMYRGNCSKGVFSKLKPKQLKIKSNIIKIFFDFIALDRLPESFAGSKFILKVLCKSHSNKNEKECIMTLKCPGLVWEGSQVVPFVFDKIKHETTILFRICRKKGFILTQDEVLCEGNLDIESLQRKAHPDFGNMFKENILLNGLEVLTIHCCGHFENIGNHYNLYLKQGVFKKNRMPNNLEEVFQEEEMTNSAACTCNTCEIAQHIFVDDNSKVILRCVVLHNASRNVSALQVIQGDNLIAVAMLIDSSHLPLPAQLSPGFPAVTLSPADGERAFLIKDNDGDWAVIVGRWIGSNTDTDISKTDGLQIFIHKCRSGYQQKMTIMFGKEDSSLQVHHCHINPRKPSVVFDFETDDIPQYIALTFVVGMLHVLCMPRPATWKPGEAVDMETTRYLQHNELPFVVASGLNILTPSNHYRSIKNNVVV